LLTASLASAFVRVALANVQREYPRHVSHLLRDPHEELSPRKLHPAFYGSYDWHSAVHMHWLLVRLLRLYPDQKDAVAVLDRHLAPHPLAAELRYFESPAGRTFERPYGWAWLLALQAELLRHGNTDWSDALQPLAAELARRMTTFIRLAPYPIRAGTHGNTAFAGLLALDYARAAKHQTLEDAIRSAALRWYGADRDAPLAYEPSLDEFLSPALVEAALMREVMPARDFGGWLKGFLPRGIDLAPPTVADRSDAKQSHLDGLALSRAWCLRKLGDAEAAERQLAAALPHVVGGDYVGEHWLASFAVLALSEEVRKSP
jgi:hypothetical protein